MRCAAETRGSTVRRRWLLLDPSPNLDLFRGQWLHPEAERAPIIAEVAEELYGPDVCQSAWALSTRKTYAAWCVVYETFARRHGVDALPLLRLVVVRWIDHLDDKLSGSTINVALFAPLAWSKLNNQADLLVLNPTIKLAWQGIRRTRMSRARKQKAPLSEAIILAIYQLYMSHLSDSNPLECLVETRTVAWLLLGFEIAPRVPDLCGLTVCCYIPMLDGSAVILILAAKNNRDLAACLSKVSIAPAMYNLLHFPSAAEFLRLIYVPLLVQMGIRRHPACRTHIDSVHRCDVCPKLFPTWPRVAGRRAPCLKAKSDVTESIRDWLLALGVPRVQLQRFPGVSLRCVTATMAALMKVAPETTIRHFRSHGGALGIYADKPFSERLVVSEAAQRSYSLAPALHFKPLDANDDLCFVCERGVQRGILLCCESCPHSAHLRCVNLQSVPDGAWLCYRCTLGPVSTPAPAAWLSP